MFIPLQESDINTPAIGAAFVIKKHNKNDVETEISLEIGELVSVVCLCIFNHPVNALCNSGLLFQIEMPPVNESFYWKGKKGFEVSIF